MQPEDKGRTDGCANLHPSWILGMIRTRAALLPVIALVLALLATGSAYAQTYTENVLHFFAGPPDGSDPGSGNLVRDAQGNLYGVTFEGGTSGNCYGVGCGTVFKVHASGGETVLYSFTGPPDGDSPYSGLVLDGKGNLYGTTPFGGTSTACGVGCGTIFKIDAGGRETVLYNFTGTGGDGAQPSSTLVLDAQGNLYGSTSYGGVACPLSGYGCGTVFKLDTTGRETVLYRFTDLGGDGAYPGGNLVLDASGNLYGVTGAGGSNGTGTVFKVDTNGHEIVLYSFGEPPDGTEPASLTRDAQGNLYGVTFNGGTGTSSYCPYIGCGTVFKLDTTGRETVLHSFTGTGGDGANPVGTLVQDEQGNLYGTTTAGGTAYDFCAGGCGTAFEVDPTGKETVLYSFIGTDGQDPTAGLAPDEQGNLYGTNGCPPQHNEGGCGTVFELQPPANDTLTVSINGNGGVTSTDGFINCPGTCSHTYPKNMQVTLNATPSAGQTFVGWSGGCSGTGSCVVPVTPNLHVIATFTGHDTLTVSTTGNGTVTSTDGLINCPGTCSHTYPYNTQVTLNAAPPAGWVFSGWSGACSGTGSCVVTMTQNLSVGATFTQLFYQLLVSLSGIGTVTSTDGFINCPQTCFHSYPVNTQVTLNASPGQGWIFSGWTGACSGVGACNVTMTQNLSVTAFFVEPGYGIQFFPVTPCRLVDTRQTGYPVFGGTSQSFGLSSKECNIPDEAVAYSLNVTVVPRGPLGYLTIWPSGLAQPATSLLNSPDARVKANAAIVQAGITAGEVSVFATDTTDVILDTDGYFTAPGSGTYQFYPLTPCRIVDTRHNHDGGMLQAGVERDYTIPPNCGVPSSATAYSFNVTVLPAAGGLDYLTVWPKGETQPTVSTLNDNTGTVVANAAIVPAGSENATAFYAHSNATNLLVDVDGYFAAPGTGGLSLYPTAPCRVLDTRQNNGKPFSGEKTVNVVGSACAPPANAAAYIFNATVVPPGSMPYLTLWPDGEKQPTVSTLNAYDGFITSNMAIVPTNNGSIDAYAAALTQLILDISGYFARRGINIVESGSTQSPISGISRNKERP